MQMQLCGRRAVYHVAYRLHMQPYLPRPFSMRMRTRASLVGVYQDDGCLKDKTNRAIAATITATTNHQCLPCLGYSVVGQGTPMYNVTDP